jgi:copper chaperone
MTHTLNVGVSGMTCNHCVGAVTREVMKLEGVTEVTIELAPEGVSQVTIDSAESVDSAQVARAIEEAGYEMTSGRE